MVALAEQLEVLRLIAEGRSNREIGEHLFISQHTAANHVRAILQKTGCTNRAEAAAYAVHRRLVRRPGTSNGGPTTVGQR